MTSPVFSLYAWGGVNESLFVWLNSYHAPYLDAFMLTMTAWGDHANYPLYMAMALLLAVWKPQILPRRNLVIFGVGYCLTGWIVTAIKPALDFPRPLLALGSGVVHIVGRPEYFHGFPSGHATFAVLLAASLSSQASLALRWLLWIFAILVCISRPVLGAHFPADVLAGALIALTMVSLLQALEKYVLRKGFVA